MGKRILRNICNVVNNITIWLKNKDLDTPVLILDTNKDVNYDKDEGDEWITKISDFITEATKKECPR